MIAAFALALGQLTDGRVLRILLKCFAVTLALFLVLGIAGWHGLDAVLAWSGLTDARFSGAGELRGIAAFALVAIGGWLLWRILALAVLQFFADEVVEAVEARHYPAAAASARALGWREDLRNAAAEVGTLGPHEAVVANRYAAGQPLRYYLGAEIAKGALPPLREIDLVGSAAATEKAGRLLPAGFHRVGSQPVSYDFTLTRYRASRPLRVSRAALERGALVGGGGRASVLIAPSP